MLRFVIVFGVTGWMGGLKIAMSGAFSTACRLVAFAHIPRKRLNLVDLDIPGRGAGRARWWILRSCYECSGS